VVTCVVNAEFDFYFQTPEYQENYLKEKFHNIGPGAARSFATMIKLGLSSKPFTAQVFADKTCF
jgi:hypothetical protein